MLQDYKILPFSLFLFLFELVVRVYAVCWESLVLFILDPLPNISKQYECHGNGRNREIYIWKLLSANYHSVKLMSSDGILQSKLIDLSLFSAAEVDWLDDYHEQVWQKVMHIGEALK